MVRLKVSGKLVDVLLGLLFVILMLMAGLMGNDMFVFISVLGIIAVLYVRSIRSYGLFTWLMIDAYVVGLIRNGFVDTVLFAGVVFSTFVFVLIELLTMPLVGFVSRLFFLSGRKSYQFVFKTLVGSVLSGLGYFVVGYFVDSGVLMTSGVLLSLSFYTWLNLMALERSSKVLYVRSLGLWDYVRKDVVLREKYVRFEERIERALKKEYWRNFVLIPKEGYSITALLVLIGYMMFRSIVNVDEAFDMVIVTLVVYVIGYELVSGLMYYNPDRFDLSLGKGFIVLSLMGFVLFALGSRWSVLMLVSGLLFLASYFISARNSVDLMHEVFIYRRFVEKGLSEKDFVNAYRTRDWMKRYIDYLKGMYKAKTLLFSSIRFGTDRMKELTEEFLPRNIGFEDIVKSVIIAVISGVVMMRHGYIGILQFVPAIVLVGLTAEMKKAGGLINRIMLVDGIVVIIMYMLLGR